MQLETLLSQDRCCAYRTPTDVQCARRNWICVTNSDKSSPNSAVSIYCAWISCAACDKLKHWSLYYDQSCFTCYLHGKVYAGTPHYRNWHRSCAEKHHRLQGKDQLLHIVHVKTTSGFQTHDSKQNISKLTLHILLWCSIFYSRGMTCTADQCEFQTEASSHVIWYRAVPVTSSTTGWKQAMRRSWPTV